MVCNHFIKCQVCGSITRVRLQVGHLMEHPIIITCGKCKTTLSGKVVFNLDDVGYNLTFENADLIDNHGMSQGDYFVECSGEFPVRKQGNDDSDNLVAVSPFIKQMMSMDNSFDGVREYHEAISKLNQTYDNWEKYKRIIDLFKKNSPYLEQEIKKVFDGPLFPCRTNPEILHTVHMIEILGFCSSLRPDILENLSFWDDVLRLNPVQMKLLNTFLDLHDGYNLQQLQSQIYDILNEFVKVYPSLIPAISLQYRDVDSFDFAKNGTTTSSFETIKTFYIDTYETLGNLMIIPVALNNIHYRGDINVSDIIKDVNSKPLNLDQYIKQGKAKRYSFCTNNEKFTAFLKLKYNAKLRNAIGHNDIEYEPINQLITYHPDPKDRSKTETEYLLEYELKALHMFQAVLVISEYLYQLRKLKLMQDGDVILLRGMASKIGPYDLCPCGSGKKYKFCHKSSDFNC